ncbi:alpha/beta-hydrolase [Ophiobolus disseminans]|uniref:Alpha/beta-hydrolase n=1 Tax=Ophiobolus disseminans TaxID=1469910 RepID=A0A6A6ZH74_9PLEO|nr:alpha/beta-hydrolase [Ophiobolus disseminans]
MASGPMQKCCLAATLHEGTPTGTVHTINNIQIYISHPAPSSPSSHPAIILLTDVYGYTFPNTRLIADAFASAGYMTLVPDLFNGSEVPWPPPESFNLQTYIETTMPGPESVDCIVEGVLGYLRGLGVKRVGGVGYCFGGRYVCRFLKGRNGEGGLDAGFVGHPSFVEEEEVRNVGKPLSIAAAQTDEIFTTAKRYETEAILGAKEVPWQICVYGGTTHGFAVKGHMSTKEARRAKEGAFKQAVAWFEEYLI